MTNLEKFYKLCLNIINTSNIKKYSIWKNGDLMEIELQFKDNKLIFQNLRPLTIIFNNLIVSENNLKDLDYIIDGINHSSARDELVYGIPHEEIKIPLSEGYVETNRMRP